MFRVILLIILTLLSGCSMFTPPREKPLLTEQFNSGNYDFESFVMAATDANRRVAIIDIFNGQICVEPPPEAANTISQAFTALLKADIKDKGNLGASLSQSISQNISQLYRRTQTVQLYRDAVFALCQSAINGTIQVDSYTKSNIQPDLREIIAAELKATKNDLYLQELNDIKIKGMFGMQTLDALNIRKNTFESEGKLEDADRIGELIKTLSVDLKQAEFKRRLEDGLREAFEVLKQELPQFYDTEKLRFIVELGKPVQVCKTELLFKSLDDGTTVKDKEIVTCDSKVPEGIEKVISEYIKALKPIVIKNQ